MLPWRQLLLSGPAWACGIAVIGSQWADATLMLGVTKYLKLVYGFSIEYVTFIFVKINIFYKHIFRMMYWPLCHTLDISLRL